MKSQVGVICQVVEPIDFPSCTQVCWRGCFWDSVVPTTCHLHPAMPKISTFHTYICTCYTFCDQLINYQAHCTRGYQHFLVAFKSAATVFSWSLKLIQFCISVAHCWALLFNWFLLTWCRHSLMPSWNLCTYGVFYLHIVRFKAFENFIKLGCLINWFYMNMFLLPCSHNV